MTSAKHGEVIEVIPRDEGGSGGEIEEFLDLGQAGALVVAGVGKAKVRTVSDGGDFGAVPENAADLLMGAVDAFLGAGDQANGSDIRDHGDLLVGGDLLLDLVEDGPVPAEKGFVDLQAGPVPFLEGVGFALFHLADFPFNGDDPLRHDGRPMLLEGFPKAFPGAAGGNHPGDRPLLSGFFQPFKKFGGERAGVVLRRERAVKVGANQQGFQRERWIS